MALAGSFSALVMVVQRLIVVALAVVTVPENVQKNVQSTYRIVGIDSDG